MTVDVSSIDPALSVMKDFAKLSGGTAAAIQQMRERAIFSDGRLSAKAKALGAVLWAVSARCGPCLTYYVQQARRLGATREELGEFLGVACAMGGCVGEMWALKAFHAYVHADDAAPDGAPACCTGEAPCSAGQGD